MLIYGGELGDILSITEYTKTAPRKWLKEEIEWMLEKKKEGHSNEEISKALGRTEVSISLKLKRLKKESGSNTYNVQHVDEKYSSNKEFIENHLTNPKTILDVYCGVNSYWRNTYPNSKVTTNDADKTIEADNHEDAFKLLCKLYYEGKRYDLVDLDPFGSAYESFDLAIKMAKKGLIITFGEIGHKRWKRLDFVNKRYDIFSLEDFTIEKLIEEVVRKGKQNKKTLTPVIVDNFKQISRVFFIVTPYKETAQWED